MMICIIFVLTQLVSVLSLTTLVRISGSGWVISAPAGGKVECSPGHIRSLLSERRGLLLKVGGGDRLWGGL